MKELISMDHGSGCGRSSELIDNLFLKHFSTDSLPDQSDSAVLNIPVGNIAFTTDSFVIQPIFFPGGDIGKLAVCGTVNDLSVSGAVPKFISCAFILEEGLDLAELKRVVISMADTARESGVKIVTGDTKVVEKGSCDKLFINTSGIGFLKQEHIHIGNASNVKPGDCIIINGDIAEHGLAVLSFRNSFENSIISDCAALNGMIRHCLDMGVNIHFMRDATRGGIAAVLSELAIKTKTGIELDEEAIPIKNETSGLCEMLGFDPLYIANEGKVIFVTPANEGKKLLGALRNYDDGKNSRIIGRIVETHKGKIVLNTSIGGRRIVDIPAGTQLPRIC